MEPKRRRGRHNSVFADTLCLEHESLPEKRGSRRNSSVIGILPSAALREHNRKNSTVGMPYELPKKKDGCDVWRKFETEGGILHFEQIQPATFRDLEKKRRICAATRGQRIKEKSTPIELGKIQYGHHIFYHCFFLS